MKKHIVLEFRDAPFHKGNGTFWIVENGIDREITEQEFQAQAEIMGAENDKILQEMGIL